MNDFDRQRAFAALILVVMALFVSSGTVKNVKWRLWLRQVTIVGFAVALAAALVEIALWWSGA